MWSSAVIHTQHLQILLFFFLLMPYNLSSAICSYLSVKYFIVCVHPSSDSFILADCLSFFHVQLFSAVFPPLYPSFPASPIIVDSLHRSWPSVSCPLQPCPMSGVFSVSCLLLLFLSLSSSFICCHPLWFLNNTQGVVVSFYFVNSWLWRQNLKKKPKKLKSVREESKILNKIV